MAIISFKNFRCALGGVLGLCILTESVYCSQLIDRVMAVVDGAPILRSEVQEKISKGPLVALSDWPAEEGSDQAQRALNDLVNIQLILKKSEDLDIEVEDADLDAQIGKLLASQGADRKALDSFLAQQGKTYEQYREDFRQQMVIRRFQGRVILPLVKITERDIQNYYLQISGSSAQSVRLDLLQMVFKLTGNESLDAGKLKTARDIAQRIKKGEDFNSLGKVYADSQSTLSGVRPNELAPAIKSALVSLSTGDVSDLVVVGTQALLFQIQHRELSGDSGYLAKKEEVENELRGREIDSQTRRWLEIERDRRKVVFIP